MTKANLLYDTISGLSKNLGTPEPEEFGSEVADDTSVEIELKDGSKAAVEGIDFTGNRYSLLLHKTSKHLNLDLIQNKEAITGFGTAPWIDCQTGLPPTSIFRRDP